MAEVKKVPGSVHLTAYYKGTWTQNVTLTDSNGDPYSIAGATAAFVLYEMNGTAVLTTVPTHTGAGGVITIAATNAQIVALATQDYRYELLLTLADTTVMPILDGIFSITEDGVTAASADDITVTIGGGDITVTLPIGIQGPPGPAGGSIVTYTAGEALAAGRVVIIDTDEAFYFQPSDATHQGRAYGITTAAAADGAAAAIQVGGEITNAAFTFGADAMLWVYDNGIIVDTAPTTTIIQEAGVSAGNNTMRINFSISILKA